MALIDDLLAAGRKKAGLGPGGTRYQGAGGPVDEEGPYGITTVGGGVRPQPGYSPVGNTGVTIPPPTGTVAPPPPPAPPAPTSGVNNIPMFQGDPNSGQNGMVTDFISWLQANPDAAKDPGTAFKIFLELQNSNYFAATNTSPSGAASITAGQRFNPMHTAKTGTPDNPGPIPKAVADPIGPNYSGNNPFVKYQMDQAQNTTPFGSVSAWQGPAGSKPENNDPYGLAGITNSPYKLPTYSDLDMATPPPTLANVGSKPNLARLNDLAAKINRPNNIPGLPKNLKPRKIKGTARIAALAAMMR